MFLMDVNSNIAVADGPLAGRTIFVCAGKRSVAEGMDILIDLAERLRSQRDIGFLFVGRGSDAHRLHVDANPRARKCCSCEEVGPSEISSLNAQEKILKGCDKHPQRINEANYDRATFMPLTSAR
jgi:hypothetical protein